MNTFKVDASTMKTHSSEFLATLRPKTRTFAINYCIDF